MEGASCRAHSIATIEDWLNNYPRRIIDFDSPNQRYKQEVAKLAA